MKKLYKKRVDQIVTAVQLNLVTAGFNYTKWGGSQKCNQGDWIINNRSECYTITAQSFADTYSMISPGRYRKVATVMAELAAVDGQIRTREGITSYKAGDLSLIHI